MMEFPNVFVDRHFSYLLSRNLYASKNSNHLISQYIKRHKGFHQLVVNCFSEVSPEKSIDFIVSILGWKNFRDRLASLYIYYSQNGKFPPQANAQISEDLVTFDLSAAPHTASGHSRAFLLALYLKLATIHLAEEDASFLSEQLQIPQEIFSLLEKSKAKTVKIDWAILLLWHLSDYIGTEKLQGLLREGQDLEVLQKLLTGPQRDQLYTNLLIYSYAIDDQEFFQIEV